LRSCAGDTHYARVTNTRVVGVNHGFQMWLKLRHQIERPRSSSPFNRRIFFLEPTQNA